METSDVIQLGIAILAFTAILIAALAREDSKMANLIANKANDLSEEANRIAKEGSDADKIMAEHAVRNTAIAEADRRTRSDEYLRMNRATVIASHSAIGASPNQPSIDCTMTLTCKGRVGVTELWGQLVPVDPEGSPIAIANTAFINPGKPLQARFSVSKSLLQNVHWATFQLQLRYQDGISERISTQGVTVKVNPSNEDSAIVEYDEAPTFVESLTPDAT